MYVCSITPLVKSLPDEAHYQVKGLKVNVMKHLFGSIWIVSHSSSNPIPLRNFPLPRKSWFTDIKFSLQHGYLLPKYIKAFLIPNTLQGCAGQFSNVLTLTCTEQGDRRVLLKLSVCLKMHSASATPKRYENFSICPSTPVVRARTSEPEAIAFASSHSF